MNLRLLRRASGRAVVVVGMTLGLTGVATSVASAQPINNWYVSPTGNDSGNTCASSSNPCATIQYALSEQALTTLPGVIHLAPGTYTQSVTAGTSNDGVTIEGAGAGKSIIADSPATLSASPEPATDTDSSTPQYYLVDVSPGTTNFGVADLTVDGLGGSSFFNSCADDYVGIYYNESSGTISHVDVTGIDLPGVDFGCQDGLGIYVNSVSGDAANVTMMKVSMLTPPVTATTTAKLPAGTYSDDIVPVNAVPKGWHRGYVNVAGDYVSASKDGTTAILISGTIPAVVKRGSTVSFYANQPAFDKNGITCDDQYTTCTIKNSVTQGEGPTNSIAQNGIQLFGTGTANLNGDMVSDDTYTGGGGAGNAAAGVLAINVGALNMGLSSANTATSNDEDIYAGEIPDYGLATPAADWAIENSNAENATSEGQSAGEDGYGVGIWVDGTTNSVQVTNNTVSGNAQSGVLLTGVQGATVSGNGIDSNEAAMVVGGPSTECEVAAGGSIPGPNCNFGSGVPGTQSPGWASYDNTISDNAITSNLAGVVIEGAFAPTFSGLAPDPNSAYGNTFSGNTWTGNTLANAVDFSGQGNPPPSTGNTGVSIEDQFGPNDPTSGGPASDNSCDPWAGGASLVNGIAENGVTVAGVSTSGDTVTGTSGSFSDVVVGDGVTGTGIASPGLVVTGVTSTTVTLSGNVQTNEASATLNFGQDWAC